MRRSSFAWLLFWLVASPLHAADLTMEVDTALSEVPVNLLPLIDDTDFKTRKTSVAFNESGMDLVWNFVSTTGAFTQTPVTPTSGSNYDWGGEDTQDGMYTIEIPASGGGSINNDTPGIGWFTGVADGILPWRGPVVQFSPTNVANSLVNGSAKLDVNAAQFSGSSTAADNAEIVFDTDFANAYNTTADKWNANVTHFGGVAGNFVSGRPDVNDVAGSVTGSVTGSVGSIATGGIGSSSFSPGAIDAAAIATGAIGALELADGAIDVGTLAADAITSAKLAPDVTTELQTGLPPQSYFEALFDGAPTFAAAMDDQGYTGARAGYLDNLNGPLATSSLLVRTTIDTINSQASFTLADGPPDDNALDGAIVIVTDATNSAQKAVGLVYDYAGLTHTVTLVTDPKVFEMAPGDIVDIIASDITVSQ